MLTLHGLDVFGFDDKKCVGTVGPIRSPAAKFLVSSCLGTLSIIMWFNRNWKELC